MAEESLGGSLASALNAEVRRQTAPKAILSDLDELFDEVPVALDTFVMDPTYGYGGGFPLSPEQYRVVQAAERIYMRETYGTISDHGATWHEKPVPDDIKLYWAQPYQLSNFITIEWGKGSGKDHTCRIISLRIAYLLCCLKSPQQYYEMPAQDSIHLLNVASSSRQASRAFFTPMRKAVLRPGNWFRSQGVEIKEISKGTRAQREAAAAQALQDTIRFSKGVEAISGHSDAETQEGLNLFLGIADEVDAFRRREELAKYHAAAERDSTRSAEGIIDMLKSSSRTRFPELFKNVYISYPRYLGSMIQVLQKEADEDIAARGERSTHCVSGPLATWDVNPRVLSKEAWEAKYPDRDWPLQEDYDKDPVFSAAKYECKPSRALNPYFTNAMAIESCEVEVERQPLEVNYTRSGAAWTVDYDFGAALKPVRGAIYAMHADLAVTGDRAGVALAHCKRQDEYTVIAHDEKGKEVQIHEYRPVVKVDFVISYSADSGTTPPREIQIRWARDLCFELRRRGFNIRRFTFDGYQSTDSMQILEANGIESDRVSTDLSEDPWRTLRDLFAERRIEMPERIRTHDELLSLSRLQNHKVDHPPSGSKDEADALACSVVGAIDLGGMEDPEGRQAYVAEANWPKASPLTELPIGAVIPDKRHPLRVAETPRVETAPGAMLSFAEGFALDLSETCTRCQAGIKMVPMHDGRLRCPGCLNVVREEDASQHQQLFLRTVIFIKSSLLPMLKAWQERHSRPPQIAVRHPKQDRAHLRQEAWALPLRDLVRKAMS